jgi:NDP-sugar pyrophosphorylase family protein
MVEVLGKPFLQHQIELLRGQGLTRFVLCVGHQADQIVSHFGDGTSLGVRIQYSHDGASPLGTGGALIKTVPRLDSWFLVLDGDSYLPIDFHAPITHFRKQRPPALMTVYENDNRHGRSNVAIEDGWVTAYNRTQGDFAFIHAGLTIFESKALEMLASDRFMLMDEIYQRLVASQKLACFILQQRFYEIGSHAGLTELKDYLTTHRAQAVDFSRPAL